MGGLDRIEARLQIGDGALDEPDAERLLRSDPNAVLLAVLLDQQMRAETAFVGPYRLSERLGHLDPRRIADMDEEAFHEAFSESPAIHRFSSMMAERTRELMGAITEQLEGDGGSLWRDADDDTIARRAKALPGYGPAKVRTLLHALELFGYR
ncbi:MAG: hypothetical protein AAFQ53_00475 [Bacteroidota bacterium]